MSALNGHPQQKLQLQHFSIETVRNLLNLDNKGIAKLCSQVSLMPKKDTQGRTYFTRDDIEILRRIKNLNQKQTTLKRSSTPVSNPNKSYVTVPVKKSTSSAPSVSSLHETVSFAGESLSAAEETRQKVQKQLSKQIQHEMQKQEESKAKANAAAAIDRICTSLSSMETNLLDKMSELIEEKMSAKLDEKLDGMDEVVVELVRCKTENETLRYKMNELNKEVYNLKNELSKYKSLGLGLYVKKNGESSLI